MILSRCVVFFVVLVSIGWSNAHARPQESKVNPVDTHGKEDLGWHFYFEDEKKKEKKEKEPAEVQTPPPVSPSNQDTPKPPPFSSEWFKANFHIIEANAVNNPTDPNAMRALLYVERVMADKSEVFAREKLKMATIDPYLQEGVRIPLSGAAKNAWVLEKESNRKAALNALSDKVGIAFFYDTACKYCTHMVPVINLLAKRTDLEVFVFVKNSARAYIPRLSPEVHVRFDEGQSEVMKVLTWPAAVILEPPKKAYIVSYGATTYDTLTARILNVALDQEILEKDWYFKVNPEQQGLIQPDQIAELSEQFGDDPVKLINTVVSLIEGSYTYSEEGKE